MWRELNELIYKSAFDSTWKMETLKCELPKIKKKKGEETVDYKEVPVEPPF